MGNSDDKQACIELPDYERKILLYIIDKIISSAKDKASLESQYMRTIVEIENAYINAISIDVMVISLFLLIIGINIPDLRIIIACIIVAIMAIVLFVYLIICHLNRIKSEVRESYDKIIKTYNTAISNLNQIGKSVSMKYKPSKLCSPDKELIDYIENLIGKRTD